MATPGAAPSGSAAWRITDGDRHAAAQALGEHYAAGRLDKGEFDERTERAYAAKTNDDLRPLFADLPAPHGPLAVAATTAVTPYRRRGPRGLPLPLPLIVALVFVMLVLSHGFFVLPLLFIGFWVLRAGRWHRGY